MEREDTVPVIFEQTIGELRTKSSLMPFSSRTLSNILKEEFPQEIFAELECSSPNADLEGEEISRNKGIDPSHEEFHSLDHWNTLDTEEADIGALPFEALSEESWKERPAKNQMYGKYIVIQDQEFLIQKEVNDERDLKKMEGQTLVKVEETLMPSYGCNAWPGNYDFLVKPPDIQSDGNKWCFSSKLKKMYVQQMLAFPVSLSVNHWLDGAFINITPIFKQSQDQAKPVSRCPNHSSSQSNEPHKANHVVQIENPEAVYKKQSERFIVEIPLGAPAPGDSGITLLIKIGCLSSCVNGPNRRPFSLFFTLFTREGQEVGRQILDVKCCACPNRDCTSEENPEMGSNKRKKGTHSGQSTSSCNQKKKIVIKTEDCAKFGFYKDIKVPIALEGIVKKLINGYHAEQLLTMEQVSLLPYPDESSR